jgi:hypothetical protein
MPIIYSALKQLMGGPDPFTLNELQSISPMARSNTFIRIFENTRLLRVSSSICSINTFTAMDEKIITALNQTDYRKAPVAVYAAGYATDVNYPAKLNKIIEQYDLAKYDKEGDT